MEQVRRLPVDAGDQAPIRLRGTITYVDSQGMGYTFAAERLSPQELLELVVSSDLIGRAQQGR